MEYSAKRDTETKIAFPGAMLGLAIQPWETAQLLLTHGRPKFIFTFLFFLIVIIFGPAAHVYVKYGSHAAQFERIQSYFVVFWCFIAMYSLFFCIYLFVLGIEFNFKQLFAIVIYSMTPVISLMLILYGLHYYASGNFAFFTALAHGRFAPPDTYAKILPYLLIIAEISIVFIIAFSIKALTEAQTLSALIYALVALGPIALAAFSSGFIADIFMPGSKELVFQIVNTLIGVWGY